MSKHTSLVKSENICLVRGSGQTFENKPRTIVMTQASTHARFEERDKRRSAVGDSRLFASLTPMHRVASNYPLASSAAPYAPGAGERRIAIARAGSKTTSQRYLDLICP
jgi:hypothetical protein